MTRITDRESSLRKSTTKQLVLGDAREARKAVATLMLSAKETKKVLTKLVKDRDAMAVLSQIKFDQIGRDPLDSHRPLNIIEQVNQTFTYLASFRAVEYLIRSFPDGAPYVLNLGTASGFDIESKRNGYLVAEVFAAVSTINNRKLKKDLAKLATVKAKHRFVFFMCPGIEEGEQPRDPEFENVRVYSVGL